jgi:thiol-disulfide isomerase/thioredoxin
MKKQKPTHPRRQQKSSQAIVYWGLAALFVLGGFLLWLGLRPSTGQVRTNNEPQLPAYTNNPAPDFELSSLQQTAVSLEDYAGQVVLVNFWATWCPPCREEMPLFVELQKRFAEQGVQFVSIAIDEPNLVRDFYDVYGINFPTMIGGVEAIKLANTLGNRFDSLPFTAIFDRNGKSHYIQAGQVSREILITAFEKLLQK